MTGIKYHPSQSTGKPTPKKAATLQRAVKFALATPPSSRTEKSVADSFLQGNKRRKYKRRGSKTPAMLLLTSKLDFDALVQGLSQSHGSDTQTPPSSPCSQKSMQNHALVRHQQVRTESKADSPFSLSKRHSPSDTSFDGFSQVAGGCSIQPAQQVRRLPMMSVLRQNLEKTSISSEKASNSLYQRLSLEMVR